jgi:hypothetical protein
VNHLSNRADETYRSLVSLSAEALKALLLLNGGAVVALLAYLGHASGAALLARYLMYPCFFFVLGLVFAALALGFAYLTQLAFYNRDVGGQLIWGVEYRVWLTAALEAGAGSLAFFAVGGYAGILALGHSQ